MAIDALDDWSLRETLLHHALAGRPEARTRERLAAAGRTPVGPMAAAPLDRLGAEAAGVARLALENEAAAGGELVDVVVEAEVDGTTVAGSVPRVGRGLHLAVTSGRMKPARLARVWVNHLALAAADGRERFGLLVGREADTAARPGVLTFAPVTAEEARVYLVALFRWRAAARTRPLPCHAGVAWKFFAADGFDPALAGDALSLFHNRPFGGGDARRRRSRRRARLRRRHPMSLEDPEGRNLAERMADELWSPLVACLAAGSGEDA